MLFKRKVFLTVSAGVRGRGGHIHCMGEEWGGHLTEIYSLCLD